MRKRNWIKAIFPPILTGLAMMFSAVPMATATDNTRIIISVPGVPGPYCAYGVEKRLARLSGVKRVITFWKKETIEAEIEAGAIVTMTQVLKAIEQADYPYKYSVEIK